jgi:hypothetical protein
MGSKKKFAKNVALDFQDTSGEELSVDYIDNRDPSDFPPWYEQFMRLSDDKKKVIVERALEQIKEAKPEVYKFIKQFKCRLVGVQPNVQYALASSKEGNAEVTWVHAFSLPTLQFFCPEGKFGFFVNANLDHDDTVLNHIKGNKTQKVRGWTA